MKTKIVIICETNFNKKMILEDEEIVNSKDFENTFHNAIEEAIRNFIENREDLEENILESDSLWALPEITSIGKELGTFEITIEGLELLKR